MKKLKYTYLFIIIIPMIILAFLINNSYLQIEQHNIDMQLANDMLFSNKLAEEIDGHYFHAKQDTVFMALNISRALDEKGDRAYADENGIEALTKNLFSSFYGANNAYKQTSYINEQGKQLAAISEQGYSIPSAPVDKAYAKYFSEAKKLKAGQAYTMFDGSTLYVSSPIYSMGGRFSGVITLELDKGIFLNDLLSSSRRNDLMLIDSSGKYIMTLGQQTKKNFKDDYSEKLLHEITLNKSGYVETEAGDLLTYTHLQLENEDWYMTIYADKDEITAHTTVLQREQMIMLFAIFFAILVMIMLWSRIYRKAVASEELKKQKSKLEDLNTQLINKQYELEEQNSMVEELNAQLEEEIINTQQQKDTLQSITHSLEEGIAMVNSADQSIFVNRAWEAIFEYSGADNSTHMGAETFVKSISACISNPNETLSEFRSLLDNYSGIYSTELEQIKPEHRYLSLYSVPCMAANGDTLGRIFVCNDITHRKEVDKLKSELISTVSHELRTPMSSIMGFSELVLTRKLSPERASEYIGIIHSESCRLTNLINDFLDIQRMENGKQTFDKHYICFDSVVKEALNLFQNIDNTHKIIYDACDTKLPNILCDHDKLIQVMSNLLSNAIKYSPDGGDVRVDVCIDANMLKVGVTDFGLGIPEEAKGKLFTKFFRIDNDDRREIGGTGLGLVICKNIIEAHGGNIWVESKYGEGSTFYFTLPITKESHSEVADIKDMKKTKAIADNTILIVEDDDNFVKLMKALLIDDGYEVYAVDNGEQALELVDKIDFKLIILDIKLVGNLNGWDVLKSLRVNNKTVNVPVIISSIYENENQPMVETVKEYLVKPFEPRQLLKEIHKVINKGLEELEGDKQNGTQ